MALAQATIDIGQVPATPHELDDQINAAAAAEDAASHAAQAAHQAASVVISTIVRIIELATPHFPSEAAQSIAESLFENWAGLAEPKVAEGAHQSPRRLHARRKGPYAHVGQKPTSLSDPTTFLHQGALASPETIVHAAAPVHVPVAVHLPADGSSDLSDLGRLLEDLH